MAKAVKKRIKGVGLRCVQVKANGQWKFVRNSACGLKKKTTTKRKKRK